MSGLALAISELSRARPLDGLALAGMRAGLAGFSSLVAFLGEP